MKKRMAWGVVLAAALLLTGCADSSPGQSRTMEPGSVWDTQTEHENGRTASDWDEYQMMLENGRVRDRDGRLADGENSHW